jgi:hypothetical protein
MKLLGLVALVLFLTALASAAECVCIKENHPSAEQLKADRREAYDKATSVFTGKVVALDAYSVTLSLDKWWKGEPEDKVILSTGAVPGYDGSPLPAECSYRFRLGQEYLVYTYGPVEKMKANSCATLQLKEATDEEKGLDQLRPHKRFREKNTARQTSRKLLLSVFDA